MKEIARLLLVIFLVGAAWPASAMAEETLVLDEEPLQPLPPAGKPDKAKVALGQKLFNDTQLSKNNLLSCASCHSLAQGGAVHLMHAPPGVSGRAVPVNVPTFFGSGFNFTQFWDGRASSLEDQMDGPVTGADEMGTSWAEIVERLEKDPAYVADFQKVYAAKPSEKHIKDALAAFERATVPRDAPFDLYLRGDRQALSPQAKEGYALFKELGCTSCHQGQNVGGNMFQKFGIINDYFHDRGNVQEKDYGRFNVTGAEEDRYVFKVPSLRNVELTAPYFHDGSAPTLEKAVDVMAKYQLGRDLSPEERAKLVAFLRSLTGKLPAEVKP